MWGLRARGCFDGRQRWPDGALIVIDGNVITGVEPPGTDLGDSVVVDAEGTVLPGLVDTHVHLCADGREGALDRLAFYADAELPPIIEESLRRSLAAGVTTVRDLGDRRYAVVDWRAAPPPGSWPTVLAAGPPLTCVRGHCWNMGGEVSGLAELATAVAERAERGVDVVKIMASGGMLTPGTSMAKPQFSDEELASVVREAHRHGLAVTAHAHPLAAIDQAVAAGVDGIEHASGIHDRGTGLPPETIERLRAGDVTVCPTLGQTQVMVPPPAVEALLRERGLNVEQVIESGKRQAADLHAAGVRVISGSDAGVGDAKPHGLCPHAVEALVAGGVAPEAALASATSVAAEAIGLGARKGRIAASYDADLVVVDGDPGVDIADLHRVRQVYVGGDLAW
jgi:imidazolonepropionase-like amidohydrolase